MHHFIAKLYFHENEPKNKWLFTFLSLEFAVLKRIPVDHIMINEIFKGLMHFESWRPWVLIFQHFYLESVGVALKTSTSSFIMKMFNLSTLVKQNLKTYSIELMEIFHVFKKNPKLTEWMPLCDLCGTSSPIAASVLVTRPKLLMSRQTYWQLTCLNFWFQQTKC